MCVEFVQPGTDGEVMSEYGRGGVLVQGCFAGRGGGLLGAWGAWTGDWGAHKHTRRGKDPYVHILHFLQLILLPLLLQRAKTYESQEKGHLTVTPFLRTFRIRGYRTYNSY